MKSSDKVILIDADVVSHFITGGEASVIHQIFPAHKIYILDKVHAELQNWPAVEMRTEISRLLSQNKITLMDFPEDNEIIKKEYFWIKSMHFKGDGESACLAVARYNKNILASSNLKDIKNYCSMHNINYLTTMDFLCEALRTKLFTEARCDEFLLKNVRNRFPVRTMKQFNCRILSFMKK